MALRSYRGRHPVVAPDAFVEESAQVIGDVVIGARSSVWFNCVIRGDVHHIRIGEETNIQDLSCLHVTHDRYPVVVGNRVTIGHGVMLHGCVIDDGALVGISSTILDGCEVGEGCLVAAGSLLTPRTKVPPFSLVRGSPAKVVRPLTEDERRMTAENAANYLRYAQSYRQP
jgi:carbonic anhydrase/acetyltransferase-like protein (isoleucine patch superfamily)